MANYTRIIVQQAVGLSQSNLTAGKYPRFVVNLGYSITGVTVVDLTDAVAKSAASAAAAKTSETNAKTSETNAKTSETNALASKNAAAASQTAAATSATNAKTSETNAKTSETNAKASETAALASKNAAATSETNAKTSETNAKTSETNALASKNAAAASQTAAKTSETNAKTSETNAKTSETNAKASETAAAGSASDALASKNAAAASQTAAKTSETNAKTSETNAKTSETNALASKNAAATSATNAATSETNALASKNAAAASQTAAKTSETNAKASETAAKTSETNAKTSETNAKASETAAAASAASIITYEPVPYPDVWAPLNDDLRLLAGIAPYDKLTISGQVLELPTKSLTFSRATTATYIDKSGVLQTAAINEPRFEKEGLLIEGQGANLVPNSQSASSWRVANTTVTQASIISPDGTTNGVTRLASAGVSNVPTGSAISVPISGLSVGGYCSFSVFAKADSHNLIQLRWLGGTTGVSNRYLNVDLSTGEIGDNNLFYAKTISMANGWWRIMAVTSIDGDLTGNPSADPGVELISSLTDGRRPAVSLATGIGVYLYGPQLESGVSSSYIPTSGAAATRANETCSIQASGNCGYTLTGDLFERTVAFELSVNVFSAPATGYHSAIAVAGAGNDIITRMRTDTLDSLRSANGLSPAIGVTYPFSKKLWIQTIDTSNKVTAYFDGKTGARTAAPANPANAGVSISFASNPNVVYHIRNFRIWHHILSPDQIRGVR